MFFLTPRYVKHGRQFIKDARKLLAYKRDLWSDATVAEFEAGVGELEGAVRARDEQGVADAATALDTMAGKHVPPTADPAWRENVEVFLVAIVIALGVRTYFLQPFTIPTGSMQPTMNGIIGTPIKGPLPNVLVRIFEGAFYGRSYVSKKAEAEEMIVGVREIKSLLPFVEKTPFLGNVGPFTRTEIMTQSADGALRSYIVKENERTVSHDLLGRREAGMKFKPGEPIVHGYFDTGDHVFVDKCTYHFRKPQRAEVFVFSTAGIPLLNPPGQPSQYYIKRLAGTPGDTLRIDPPRLFINGEVAPDARHQRVMSGTPAAPSPEGYRGYGNGLRQYGWIPLMGSPDESFTLPAKSYLALGDNSYNSLDSRAWGPVPEQNIMGRAVLVYWPFKPHFGVIR